MDLFLALAGRRNHPNAIVAANNFSGWLNYEWDDLHKATRHFETAIAHRYQGNFVAYIDAAIGLAKVQLAYGQIDSAQSTIGKAYAEALHLNSTDLLSPIQAFQAYLSTMQEDVPAALLWARSVDPQNLYECILLSELASLLHARILIWHGTDTEVITTINFLKARLAYAQTHQFTRWAIQTEIHLALAYQRQADIDGALAMLEKTIAAARSGSFIRSFVDLGQPMEELLTALDGRLLVEDHSYLNQLLLSFKTDDVPQSPIIDSQTSVAESITRRELEVLILMQIGKTDQEIADELIIALSTARRHASNIYRKLEVNNRRQAVRKAEQLGLL
jgi:LuxR family maltose regulon positive regulatory protein